MLQRADRDRQIEVAAELTQCAADSGELLDMLDAIRRNVGACPAVALADAVYRSEAVREKLSTSTTGVIVAPGRDGKKQQPRWSCPSLEGPSPASVRLRN